MSESSLNEPVVGTVGVFVDLRLVFLSSGVISGGTELPWRGFLSSSLAEMMENVTEICLWGIHN